MSTLMSSFLTNMTLTGGASGKSVTLAITPQGTFDASGLIGNLASFTTSGTAQTIKGGSGKHCSFERWCKNGRHGCG